MDLIHPQTIFHWLPPILATAQFWEGVGELGDGAWTLWEWLRRNGGDLHSDWSSLLQNGLQNSIHSASCGPHPLPELQLAQHSGGGTHRGLVHLKGWERPKARFSCRVFRQLVPKFQEHPPLFNHGLCEYGDPPPTLRPRDGLGAQPGRARVDQDLGSSSRGAALNKCLFWASVAVSVK